MPISGPIICEKPNYLFKSQSRMVIDILRPPWKEATIGKKVTADVCNCDETGLYFGLLSRKN